MAPYLLGSVNMSGQEIELCGQDQLARLHRGPDSFWYRHQQLDAAGYAKIRLVNRRGVACSIRDDSRFDVENREATAAPVCRRFVW